MDTAGSSHVEQQDAQQQPAPADDPVAWVRSEVVRALAEYKAEVESEYRSLQRSLFAETQALRDRIIRIEERNTMLQEELTRVRTTSAGEGAGKATKPERFNPDGLASSTRHTAARDFIRGMENYFERARISTGQRERIVAREIEGLGCRQWVGEVQGSDCCPRR